MPWLNPPARLYQGTHFASLAAYSVQIGAAITGFNVDLTLCRPNTDFGRCFYLTSNAGQARDWANNVVRKTKLRTAALPTRSVLLAFDIDRDALSTLETLFFLRPCDDFHAFVEHCRTTTPPTDHGRSTTSKLYDIVAGPVRLWPQRLVVQDADQVAFNTEKSIAILPEPVVIDIAIGQSGLF